MDPCIDNDVALDTEKGEKKYEDFTVKEMEEQRRILNDNVMSRVKETEWSKDWMEQMVEDADEGMMARASVLDEETLKSKNMTRAIPVREWRPKGWRTRVVYHYTESAHNAATHLKGRITHQTTDCLVVMILMMLRAQVCPVMWKRDIRKAFKSLPVMVGHHWYSYIVFAFSGHYYAALQYSMPFGCIAAVFGNFTDWEICWNMF